MTEKISENKSKLSGAIASSIRTAIGTMFICCLCYSLLILGIGQIFTPHTANGSLILAENGTVIGSELLAQNFSKPEYFHSRPSAGGYNAMASAGSNLSPASDKIKERAASIITESPASTANPIPTDMITASGSGLDPHISLQSALFQAPRIAKARNINEEYIAQLVNKNVVIEDFITDEPIVNVLLLNIALDKLSNNVE